MKPSKFSDLALLQAIQTGVFDLKLKKLRALGFIEGKLPKLEITDDGIQRIKSIIEREIK